MDGADPLAIIIAMDSIAVKITEGCRFSEIPVAQQEVNPLLTHRLKCTLDHSLCNASRPAQVGAMPARWLPHSLKSVSDEQEGVHSHTLKGHKDPDHVSKTIWRLSPKQPCKQRQLGF